MQKLQTVLDKALERTLSSLSQQQALSFFPEAIAKQQGALIRDLHTQIQLQLGANVHEEAKTLYDEYGIAEKLAQLERLTTTGKRYYPCRGCI